MPYYLDLGAQRVQEWITATPELKLLRGASHALKTLTAAATVTGWLAADGLATCQVAEDAGEKDGVVVVEAPDEASARAASGALLARLRRALPRVQWAGWWVEENSYLEAHHRARAGDAAVRRVTSHPVPYDVPVLEQCPSCRQEPAGVKAAGHGPDCAVRLANAEPPRDLMVNVDGRWPIGLDFNEFAARGGLAPGNEGRAEALGRTDSRNHLALVKADGNKIGQVFDEIARHADALPTMVAGAVNALNAATQAAVEEAARHPRVTDTNATLKGVIPHYVGGDDVLVSVPAPRAWRFAAQLAGSFELVRRDWRALLDADLPPGRDDAVRGRLLELIDEVSLGVGLVFAHSDHPLAASVRVADRALRAAKLETAGTASAIAWVDLTAEGLAGASFDRRWLQVIGRWAAQEQLDAPGARFPAEGALFEVEPAGRARLYQVVREALPDESLACERALAWCRANGRSPHLEQLAQDDVLALLPLVSRARWWPATPA